MIEVISVRFRGGCKAYFFDPQGIAVQEGDAVVVETAQGAEFGTCVCANHMVEDHAVIQPLRPMRRLATDEDRALVERNHKREKEAVAICEKKIAEHGLEMKLVNVECSFEGNKVIFFFTADGRVDFRDLVKDLASVFHARIELRQIGVRDEAKMLGGLGICGQPFCCKQFLDDFQPVSIKMAKTQNLSLNPTKISGSCGRLMCCLKYEQHAYEDAMTRMPKNDSFVQTPDGPGNVSAINLVRETVTVRLDDAPESPKVYKTGEIIVLRNGKGSRDGIAIPDRPARIEEVQETDLFAAPVGERPVTPRQFRNAPPQQRKSASSLPQDKKSSAKPAGEEKKDTSRKGGEAEKNASAQGEKSSSRRSHRGSRGRRGGENRENQNQKKDAPQKDSSRRGESRKNTPAGEKRDSRENTASSKSQAPRPVYFGSSMPMADNVGSADSAAKAPKGESAPKGGNNRRGRRPFRKGRGSGKNSTGSKES